ncbi:hypothetical protein I5415_03325 [Citrobacter sp. FDAARGOS_156]|uniref:hypothetical protein n=1 Tax=Citrobacter sp. FDAARGOS_156 TaxID=1702170 RepID=UPI0002675710|nr:hypothetical protein [Citrobacter sp. FDAARGOS_156]EIQ74994.1 hypothetical protein SF123566_3023 [Shigella flexneri 1235-66]MBJ8887567.1 hypothetical protein [Citrobacter sp. FDAARGOS_156]
MKTPVEILESVAADIVENTSLLEVIYRINELPPEADNAIACLIRSMQKTLDGVNEYVSMLPTTTRSDEAKDRINFDDINDDVFNVAITVNQLNELAHIYNESYFTDKDSDDPKCLMSATIYDYARKVKDELKIIESKLG